MSFTKWVLKRNLIFLIDWSSSFLRWKLKKLMPLYMVKPVTHLKVMIDQATRNAVWTIDAVHRRWSGTWWKGTSWRDRRRQSLTGSVRTTWTNSSKIYHRSGTNCLTFWGPMACPFQRPTSVPLPVVSDSYISFVSKMFVQGFCQL